MKNDKLIAFTELSFQTFSGKLKTIIQYPKPISWNVLIRILSLQDTCILPVTKYVITTAIMTKNTEKFISFFKVNQIITLAPQ